MLKSFLVLVFAVSVGKGSVCYADLVYTADFSTDGLGFTHKTNSPPAGSPFSGPNWVASYSGTPATDSTLNEFWTQNGKMRIQDWGGLGRLESSLIDVSSIGALNLTGSLTQLNDGADASGEFMRFFYSLDGGAEIYTTVDGPSSTDSLAQWSVNNLDVSGVNNLVVGFEFDVNGSGHGWEVSSLRVDSLSAVPEPSSLMMLGVSMFGLVLRRRR